MKQNKKNTATILYCCTLLVLISLALPVSITSAMDGVKHTEKIILFHNTVSPEEILMFSADMTELGASVVMNLPLINGVVLSVPPSFNTAPAASDPRVARIEDNHNLYLKDVMEGQRKSFIKPFSKPGTKKDDDDDDDDDDEDTIYPWGILEMYDHPFNDMVDTVDKDNLSDEVRDTLKDLRYKKVRIAVFDTGLSPDRPGMTSIAKGGLDVAGSTLGAKVMETGKTVPLDDNGHGTHVAGIISMALDRDFEWGIEDSRVRVELYGVKVLDKNATGRLSNIIMGLQWAIDNDIDVINMSIGFRQDSPIVRLAVQEASKAGLIMVASTGNHSNYDDSVLSKGMADGGAGEGGSGEGGSGEGGSGEGGSGEGGSGEGGSGEAAAGNIVSTPSLPMFSTMYPARYPEVIAVAASTMGGMLTTFSNVDDRTDIMAPGEDIISMDITNGDPLHGYGICSGTSMAAPHVTAAIALMLVQNPRLTPENVKEILTSTADFSAGDVTGELNLSAALKRIDQGAYNNSHNSYRKAMSNEHRNRLKERMSSYFGKLESSKDLNQLLYLLFNR